jgi:hypothetical protein
MDTCPTCNRKLISHSSAKCNWCGAVIPDGTYQAQAAASRNAYFAEEAAHDAASLASAYTALDPNAGNVGFFVRRRSAFGFLRARANNPLIPPSAALPGYPPQAGVPPYGMPQPSYPAQPNAVQGFGPPPTAYQPGAYPPQGPPAGYPNPQNPTYAGTPVPPAFGTDPSLMPNPSAQQYLANQTPVYPAGQQPTTPEDKDDPQSPDRTGRFDHLEF